MNKGKYLPVPCDFYDLLTDTASLRQPVKVNYFVDDEALMDAQGLIGDIENKEGAEYLVIGEVSIRLDHIVTINGKVGPAYGDYEAFSDACMSCNLGYDHQGNPKDWK
ncbi:hypothetical protein [Persicobacter psychrovividus]|uniref:Uncharacterized protein n=1 Tax=Persicobacter psychrovividus TaxID=387638 RepID=A0ABM7VKW4_9BACT|nr:hypothetical protein PEPS_38910 [Persicobacter psychrovividus]